MAEHVQAALDAMVAPLLDLQERQVFTADEIRAIVARRRASEYSLRRRNPRKIDFVTYLQDEMRLEQLRQLRTKRQRREELQNRQKRRNAGGDDHDDKQSSNKHIGDRHIWQHILQLWTRTMRKYRDDLSLWLSYIQFVKSIHKYRTLSTVYGEALRFHPRATGLWVEAAGYEAFDRSNVDAARVLLQRGLRLNPSSRELWHQAFVLELHVVQKLQGRQKVLHPEAVDGDYDEVGGSEDVDGANRSGTTQKDPYVLARIVLEHAAQELKKEKELQSLWLECLESCQSFPSRSTLALQKDLLHKLRNTSGKSSSTAVMSWMAEAAWVRNHPTLGSSTDSSSSSSSLQTEKELQPKTKRARISAPSDTKYSDHSVLQVLREATQSIQSEEMYVEAIRFLTRHIRTMEAGEDDEDDDENDNDSDQAERVETKKEKDDTLDEAYSLLQMLWDEAKASDFYTPRIVLNYVDYLLEIADEAEDDKGHTVEAAIQVLQDYIAIHSADTLPASLWMRLAQLQLESSSAANVEDAASTLRRGIHRIPPYQRDHLTLLVQLMGTLLEAAEKSPSVERSKELWSLLDRILLAYPGGTLDSDNFVENASDDMTVPEVCVAFQRHVADQEGLDGSRRLYEKLLFQSGFAKLVLQEFNGAQYLERIVDQAMMAESKGVLWKDRRTNQLRLVDFAVRTVTSKPLLEKYRKARDEIKYGTAPRLDLRLFSTSLMQPKVPSFDVSSIDVDPQLLRKAYDVFQVVHLRNVPLQTRSSTGLTWRDLDALYQNLDAEDQKSWCVETGGQDDVSPQQFLKNEYSSLRAYCSFLIQNDKEALDLLLAKLPSPPPELLDWEATSLEPAVWVFFGRNAKGTSELDGRPEHTDSVSHDGTWHVQISGKKRWILRPSCSLVQHLHQYLPQRSTKLWTEEARMDIECSERDVLVINTRLWFHQTAIPVQPKPSVSLARDFRFTPIVETDRDGHGGGTMSNVDGLYACSNIDEGTIIFAEDEMPDAELHVSSSNPNCQVVDLDDGSRAVVALRPIMSGEFFCVAPSEDEGDDDDEGDDEGDEDEYGQEESSE